MDRNLSGNIPGDRANEAEGRKSHCRWNNDDQGPRILLQSGGQVKPGEDFSSLFIHPPYRFRVVDGLVTNFHLPKSTLIMLVSAFAGKDLLMKAYQEAVKQKYRFYSYGDAMLIL